MLHQVQAVPQKPDLPCQVLSSSVLYRWDSTTTDHGAFSCLLHLSYIISPKSNAPSSEVIRSKKGMCLQYPAFSLQVQAGSIPVLKLNSHTLSTKYQVTYSYFHQGIFHIHLDCAFRSWCPHSACRQAAGFAEISCLHKAAFWGAPSCVLAGWGAASQPGTRRHESWASTSSSAPLINSCQVPVTFIQGCPRT